ncbi:MAG: hypothetical protein K2Q18_00185 [Bdellovibrionales bacterium]|nr:hypothetical protein [Bdellovibrionales bacterium]
MKNTILILSLVAMLSGCGKSENSVTEVRGGESLSTFDLDSLVGSYDILRTDSDDCSASLRIVKVCDGIQVRGSNSINQSFCNINKGEIKTGDNRGATTVTLETNVLKSVSLLFDERSTPPGNVKQVSTNILTLDSEGNLLKLAELKTGKSSCLYQKR